MNPEVHLRDVEADDLPLFFDHQRDPIAVAMVAFNSRDRAAFDAHWAKLLADDSCLKKTIVVVSAVSADSPAVAPAVSAVSPVVASAVSADPPTVASAVSADPSTSQIVAGNIGSWTSDGKREIGYWIDRALWGRGIATQALSAFLQLEQTRPLHAGVAKHNAGSIRVLQKCGFTLVGQEEASPDDAEPSHVLLRLL